MYAMKSVTRKSSIALAMMAIAASFALPQAAQAETVVRIGMTAADIPRTLGQPDQGFEGNRFTGLTMYDALTAWDLSSADKASVVIPGLSTEWAVNPDDKTKWHVQASARRDLPRRFAVQCRRGGLERREGAEAGRAAVRRQPGRRHRLAHADARVRAQDRRPHGRADHQGAGLASCRSTSPTCSWRARRSGRSSTRPPKAPTRRRSRRPPGRHSRPMPPAPVRGRCRNSRRANGSRSSRTTPTGTRRACRRSTGW